jgi:hypothetical protein
MITLTGFPAALVLLAIYAVVCAPFWWLIWRLSLRLRDWSIGRLEHRFRRKMASPRC